MRSLICLAGNIAFLLKKRTPPTNPKKIVIMRSAGIGDVLMSTPLVKAVRLKYPNAKITYLVGQWSADAIKGNPNVDEVMTYNDEIIFGRQKAEVDKLIAKISGEKFELGFILDKAWQWNLLAQMAKIKFRVGFDRRGEGFANNMNVKFEGKKYELEYYRDLAKKAGFECPSEMQIYYTKKDKQKAEAIWKKLDKKRTVVLIPGAAKNPGQEMAEKRWPNYAGLADELIKKKYSVVLLGGKTDKQIHEQVKKSMKKKALDLAGKLSLKESAAFLSMARLTITHDSGPMHLAAAVHSPLITIFGPTDPNRFAPKNAIVIQDKRVSPSYDIYGNLNNQAGDLSIISVDTVLNSALKLLKK